jgi:hypothetical protein
VEKVMETLPTLVTPTAFPMQELEQIESAIRMLNPCVSTIPLLRPCVSTLESCRATLFQELDLITRPQFVKPPSRTIGRGFEYRGTPFGCWYAIDVHVDLLRRLWTDFPERRHAMAEAMGGYGRNRAYVATDLARLFRDQSIAWAERYSRTLIEGWVVDTNLNPKHMRRILPAAVKAAGLRLGVDVKIYWHSTQACAR